jgi:hypothetical protein
MNAKVSKFFLFPGLAFCLVVSFTHPFYLSVTDLRYNDSTKRLEGSIRVFLNDMEDALSRLHSKTVDLTAEKDTSLTRVLIDRYLQDRLGFRSNEKDIRFRTIGFEKEEEAIWIHIESVPLASPTSLRVKNRVLYDFLPTQSNIIHYTQNDRRQSTKISNPDSLAFFNFK